MTSNELVATRRQVRFRGCVTAVSSVFQADQNTVAFLLFSLSSLFPLICGQGGTLADRTKGSIGFFWTKGGEAERGKSVVFFGENRGEENASFPFCVPRSSSSSWLSSSKRPALILGESGRARCYSLLLSLSTLSCLVLSCPIPTKYRTYLVHYARLARTELGTGFSTGSLLFSLSFSPSTKSHRYLLRSDQITG